MIGKEEPNLRTEPLPGSLAVQGLYFHNGTGANLLLSVGWCRIAVDEKELP